MSAFQVSDTHIVRLIGIAQALHNGNQHASVDSRIGPFNEVELFTLLAKVNADSVGYRYGEDVAPVPAPDILRIPRVTLETVEDIAAAIKVIDCYAYQACEHPSYSGGSVDAWCTALIQGCIRMLPRFAAAYRDAAWSL